MDTIGSELIAGSDSSSRDSRTVLKPRTSLGMDSAGEEERPLEVAKMEKALLSSSSKKAALEATVLEPFWPRFAKEVDWKTVP